MSHLGKYLRRSREKFRKHIFYECAGQVDEATLERLVNDRVRDELKSGVQTIQYQVLTLLTTNGQAPFVTVFMYLGEAKNEQEKKDLALIIEETLEQRYQGVKNEKGVWITPAFPKLIYVLEEDNVHEDSPYYYLTKLAAKCTARRMVPDYISAKKMLELKGDVYTCMGCRSFLSPWMDFVYAKLMLNAGISSQWTVAIGLYNMLDKSLINTYFGQFCAGGVLVSIPISVLFVIMQKFYVVVR